MEWALVSTDITEANVLHHLRVDVRLFEDLLEQLVHDEVERSIFHATFEAFGQGRSYGECNDYIVGVLLGSVDIYVSADATGLMLPEGTYIADSPLLLGER